jgi:hypothetical protein
MSSDTWVLAALFPDDIANSAIQLECRQDVAVVLQSKPLPQRLIRSGQKKLTKYQERESELKIAWPRVRAVCSEADRFSQEFLATLRPA